MINREFHEEALLLAGTVSPYLLALRVLELQDELEETICEGYIDEW